MGSPLVIADAPGAAIIGGGFIGPVHVEALRRIGVEVVGLLGSSPERLGRGPPAGDPSRLPRPRRGPGRRARGRRPRRLAQFEPLRAGSPDPRIGPARRLREAAGQHVGRDRGPAALAESRPDQAAAVNYNIRYYPLCREVRERIAAGALGRVLSVTGSYVQDWLLYPDDYNWRVEADGRTNLRAVADIGTHWMDLAQYLVGVPIRSVNADLATFHPRRKKPTGPTETFTGSAGGGTSGPQQSREVDVITDDHAAVLLRFDSGVRAPSTSRRSPPAGRTA